MHCAELEAPAQEILLKAGGCTDVEHLNHQHAYIATIVPAQKGPFYTALSALNLKP